MDMSEFEEWAKATQEGSKAVVAVAESYKTTAGLAEKTGGFLSKVFGTTIENGVGIIGDKLEYTRWERQNRLIEKVNEYQKEKKFTQYRPIPPKFAIPMIVNASLEDDNELQDIWCKLITNSLNPNFDVEIRYAYIDIIKNLTSLDAKILKFIHDKALSSGMGVMSAVGIDEIIKNISVPENDIKISLSNLMRVQCILDNSVASIVTDIYWRMICMKNNTETSGLELHISYSLTEIGYSFIQACII